MTHQHDHNYFSYAHGQPFHLSVGAILMNDKGKICVHHFQNSIAGPELNDVYLLMRETITPNETIESAVARGLMEEFGAKARIVDYFGSLTFQYSPYNQRTCQKTTLYFLCQLISQDLAKRSQVDFEGKTTLEWLKPDDLIEKMTEQTKRIPQRTDIDESEIIKRLNEKL